MEVSGARSSNKTPLAITLALVVLLAIVGALYWWHLSQATAIADHIMVYYTQPDGTTEASRSVLLGPAHDRRSVAFYAATQVMAGPPAGVDAVRFPNGTTVRSVDVTGSNAVVDLSKEVDGLAGGSFRESATFKSLVWTMTALPGIKSVSIRVDGEQVAAIPGGHFELDEPLTRSDW
jgi:spore germination protein GerM